MAKRSRPITRARLPEKVAPPELVREVRPLILAAREHVAQAVNAGLTLLYWQVGDRIRREVLNARRAQRGERIVASLAGLLEREFGRGFAEKNLRRMIQFAEVFPDQRIVVSLIRHLAWTHFIALIPILLHRGRFDLAREKALFLDRFSRRGLGSPVRSPN